MVRRTAGSLPAQLNAGTVLSSLAWPCHMHNNLKATTSCYGWDFHRPFSSRWLAAMLTPALKASLILRQRVPFDCCRMKPMCGFHLEMRRMQKQSKVSLCVCICAYMHYVRHVQHDDYVLWERADTHWVPRPEPGVVRSLYACARGGVPALRRVLPEHARVEADVPTTRARGNRGTVQCVCAYSGYAQWGQQDVPTSNPAPALRLIGGRCDSCDH
jgi:hypothetical protein